MTQEEHPIQYTYKKVMLSGRREVKTQKPGSKYEIKYDMY